jgi:hypothetical protein
MDTDDPDSPSTDPRVVPDRLRLPLSFDPDLLLRDLDGLSAAEWVSHYVRQNYSGDWSVLPLRAPAGETHPVRLIYSDPTCQRFVDTAFLAGCSYFREVLAALGCPLLSVRLMRLAAGSEIKEHTDYDLRFEEGKARLHVPVVTNDGVEFYLNDRRVVMAAGECWYLRLSDPHRVVNRGATDRVHLVIDVKVNGWLTGLFRAQLRRLGS